MKLARIVVLAAAWTACSEAPSASRTFELRDVVAPALAEFGALAEATLELPVPAEALPEELGGMLETIGAERGKLHAACLKDLRDRGDAIVPHLAKALADAESPPKLRSAAIEVLAAIDSPPAIEALVRALTADREPWVRAQCAWRLAESRQDRFVPRILLRLRYEADDETAVWLADCLARHGNYAGIDGACVVRNRARTSELALFANQHLSALAARAGAPDGDALNAQWSSGELERRLPAPAPSRELECAMWKRIQDLGLWDLRGVDDCRFALSRSSAWIVEPLARTLHEKNVYLRVHAAQCLERMGPRARAAGDELLAALEEPRVAPAAAAALGAVGHVAACARLELALAAQDLELACAAARALGALGQARAQGPLRRAYGADSPLDLRQAAAESLLALDAADVVGFLAQRMTAPRAENVAAENALARWLARRTAAGEPGFALKLDSWRKLDVVPLTEIPDREQTTARLAARAKLAEGW